MRVCIYGAGAIGGHLAVRLALGGATVSVVARGPHLAAIQASGLTVHAPDGTHHARPAASDDPDRLGRQDAVLVTVKAPALPQVAAGLPPLLGPDTAVAFVMNGIPWWYCDGLPAPFGGRTLPRVDPGDVVRRAVGPARTIGGVVYAASAVIAPGVVEVEQARSRVILGEPDGRMTDRIAALAALLTRGGISGETTPAIRDEIWNKLLSNLAGGTMAVLTGAPPKAIYVERAAEDTARRVMAEATALARALGADPKADHEARIANGRTLDHKPSILQDLELGRPMEIDGIFDAPLALARLAGVATPRLDLLVALCKLRARAAGLYGGDNHGTT
ncbi:MAG: 2-dehydropantoate 2-reductase [Rhodospirillales bacterium]|nr:2-dehydropantoate 2-reductase [Rhodospirillales bacterium]